MSLACASHCIPTFRLYSNRQRDKEWQWHGIWQHVHGLMYVQGTGYRNKWMHVNLWKLPCFNASKTMQQWLMMVTCCPSSGGWIMDDMDGLIHAAVVCLYMFACLNLVFSSFPAFEGLPLLPLLP